MATVAHELSASGLQLWLQKASNERDERPITARLESCINDAVWFGLGALFQHRLTAEVRELSGHAERLTKLPRRSGELYITPDQNKRSSHVQFRSDGLLSRENGYHLVFAYGSGFYPVTVSTGLWISQKSPSSLALILCSLPIFKLKYILLRIDNCRYILRLKNEL